MEKDNNMRKIDPCQSKKGKAPLRSKSFAGSSVSRTLFGETKNTKRETASNDSSPTDEIKDVSTASYATYRQPTSAEKNLPSTSKGFYVSNVQEPSVSTPPSIDFRSITDISRNMVTPLSTFEESTIEGNTRHIPSQGYTSLGKLVKRFEDFRSAIKLNLDASISVPTHQEQEITRLVISPNSKEFNNHEPSGKNAFSSEPNAYTPMYAERISDEILIDSFSHLQCRNSYISPNQAAGDRRNTGFASSLSAASDDSSGSSSFETSSKNNSPRFKGNRIIIDHNVKQVPKRRLFDPIEEVLDDFKRFRLDVPFCERVGSTSFPDTESSFLNPTHTSGWSTDATISPIIDLMPPDAKNKTFFSKCNENGGRKIETFSEQESLFSREGVDQNIEQRMLAAEDETQLLIPHQRKLECIPRPGSFETQKESCKPKEGPSKPYSRSSKCRKRSSKSKEVFFKPQEESSTSHQRCSKPQKATRKRHNSAPNEFNESDITPPHLKRQKHNQKIADSVEFQRPKSLKRRMHSESNESCLPPSNPLDLTRPENKSSDEETH